MKERSYVKIADKGKYLYFSLRKKNWNTLDVIQKIAAIFGVSERKIGFAGSKDKNAVTEQICSVEGLCKERLQGVKLQDVVLEFLGYGDLPISLGDLLENYFEIMIRNLVDEKV